MTIAHSDADGTRGNHRSADRDREFVLDAQAWNSIAARIMMSSSSSSSSGGGSVPSGGTARKNLTRSWNYGESSRHRQSSRHARVEDNETECHEDENDRGDVDQERVSLVFGGGMTRSKSTPSLRNEARSSKDDDGMDAQPDGAIGNDGTSNENNNNNINNNKRSTSRRRQVLGSWLQSRAASAASSNPADRDGDTASKSSWKSKLKSMRSKSTPRSRSRSSSQPQPQPRPQSQSQRLPKQRHVPHTQQFAMAAPSPRSAPLDTSHLKFRNTATNSSASTAASTATTAASTPTKQTMNISKSAKSQSFHNSKRPTPDNLAKAASVSNNSNNYNNYNNDTCNDKNNDKNNGTLLTCNIHPEVRIRRNKCPLCAAEQTKKLRRSFHGNVHHRGSANDAAAATVAPSVVVAESRVHSTKVDRNGNGNGDGQPVDNVAVTATSDDPAAARTTKSHPDLQHFVSSNIEIEADSRNGGKLPPQQQQQQQPQPLQRQYLQRQHLFLHQQQQSQLPHRYPQEQQGKPPIYTGNNNNKTNNNNADEDIDGVGESDSRSEESSRGEGGNVVDGIIHNFLEKMRLLSSQHGQQHPERQRDRDVVEEGRDNRLNYGNFQNCRGDGANEFDVCDGHRDNQDDHNDDDVADHRGDYTGYIHPHNDNCGNIDDQHGGQDECNDDHNSLRGCYGPQNNHHIQYKYQHSFDDDVHVSKEGIWHSRPFEDRTLPAMLAESECFQEHKHSFYSEEPTSGEWKESKASYSFVNDNRLLEPTSQLHSMVKDGDAIVQPSLKSSLSTLSELQETILLATKSIGKFSPSEDEYDDFDFLGDDHRPMDEYHDGDGNDELFHQDFGRISPSNSLEGNKSNYLPKGLHHHITSRISDNDDKNATFDDDDCCSQESTDDEGSISSMARRGDQPVKRFAESKGSFLPFGGVAAPPLAEEKYPNVYDELEERSQFYQQRESAMTRQVCPQHERLVQQPSEPPMEVDCDSNSSGSSVTMDEFSSSRSLSSKSSFVALEKREKEVDRMDHIASKENEVDKESEHVEDMPPPSANRVSFTVEDEAEFQEVEGDVPVYDSERLIPKPKNAEDNISPCSVILNDDNSGEVQLPFGPPFSKVESYSEAEAGLVKEDSEVCDQPKEVNKSMKTPVEGKPQAHSQRQGRPTKRSSLRLSLKQDRSSRRSSSGAGVEAEDVNIDAECDETDISRTGFKPSHQPSFFSALVQNSRQARSLSKSRTRARSRSKSRTRKAAKVVAAADPNHNADFQQNADVIYAAKIDENENMKDIGSEEDLHRTSVKAQNDGEITSEPLSANNAERKTSDETPKKRKKKATKPDPPRNIRGPIAHPYYKLGDVARDEDMIVFPKKNSRSRRRRRHRRRHRSKSRTASLSSSDSSCSSDSDRDSDNESDDDSVDEREAKRKHAIYMSIKELRHLDAAFVKRSDGTWTYAIVCDWIDDEVRFVVNGRGSTKSIPQNIWRSNVRRIKVLSQRSGDNFISKDSSSRKKRTIGRGRSSSKSARAKGRMVSPSPTRRTSTMNYMPTIAENKRYN